MSTTTTSKDSQKLLRIGILQAGKIVEEKLIRKRERITVGTTPKKCTFYVPKFPSLERVVIDVVDGVYTIPLGPDMDARVGLGDKTFGLPELQSQAKRAGKGPPVFPLDERARGKLVFGDVTVLFQFVTPPPAIQKPQALPVIRRTPSQWLAAEGSFLIGIFVSLVMQSSVVAVSMSYTVPEVKKTLADRYKKSLKVDVNFEQKKKEEAKKEEPKKDDEAKEEKAVAALPKQVYTPPPMPQAQPKPSAQLAQGPKKAPSTERPTGRPAGPAKPAGDIIGQRRQVVVDKTFLRALGSDGDPGGGPDTVGVGGGGAASAQIAAAFDRPSNGAAMGGDAPGFQDGPAAGPAAGGAGAAPRVAGLSAEEKAAAGMNNTLKVEKVAATPAKGPEVKASPRLNVGLSGAARGGGIGKLDSAAVSTQFKKRASAFRTCYEGRLRDKPNLAGKVVIRFTIGTAGRVTAINVSSNTTGDTPVGACIIDKVRNMRFDKPTNGDVTFSYPIVLSKGN